MVEEEKKMDAKEQENVLVFHGWEDSSEKGFIPELVKTLKEKGYSAKAFDLPNTNAPKFKEWFDFAEKEVKKLEGKKISLVGHSMGGLLVLKLAENYKVNKLVAVAPVGSKPSEKYFETTTEDINDVEREILRDYCNRDLDANKVKENAKEIDFVFGMKDPWINEEIRKSYTEKFKDIAKIKTYDNYAHMSESEGVKKLPEVEKLFGNKEQETKVEKVSEEIKEEVKEEIKKDIPSSPETKTEKARDEAAEKVAEEVKEETEKVVEKIADVENKKETKKDDKKPAKKKEEKVIPKKDEAVAHGSNLHMSKKHGVYICSFIKNKKVDDAISDLEEVRKLKKIVPFKGEIPHKKGKGMMSGRYPIKASGLFISLLKGLKGNIIVNGMDLEKSRIVMASANWGRRPMRSNRRQGKRTNLILKAMEVGK